MERSSVFERGEPVLPLHEGLGEVPGTGPVVPVHHVDSVGVGRRRLPGEVGLNGPPVRVGEVVVPTVVPLLLVLVAHALLAGHHGHQDHNRGHKADQDGPRLDLSWDGSSLEQGGVGAKHAEAPVVSNEGISVDQNKPCCTK